MTPANEIINQMPILMIYYPPDPWNGIYLDSSNNNNISGNSVINSWDSAYLQNSNGDILSGNTIYSGWSGIYLASSNNKILTGTM